MYRKNVAGQYLYFGMVSATDGSAATGKTVTGKRAIDGGAQASVTGTIGEEAGGQYKLALSQADINGNNIGFLFTATGCVPVNICVVTTAANPTDAAAFGLTNLDAAVSSRSTYAGADTSGTTTLLSRLTSTRAGNLDNLDAAVSTRLASASYTAPDDAATIADSVLTTAMTEAYGADGGTVTVAQALYELLAHLGEKSVSGTTLTLKKRDGSTTAATYTLDDATAPTSITRAT